MDNKKIRNATSKEVEGIKFKSKLEADTYRLLKEAGFHPQYEERKFLLCEGFKPTVPFYTKDKVTRGLKLDNDKVRDMTYTPDFTFKSGGFTVVVEAKGYENDRFPLKKKLFRKLLESEGHENFIYFEIFSQRQCKEMITILKQRYESI